MLIHGLSVQSGGISIELSTSELVGGLEISHMNPAICTILDSLQDRKCLMISSPVNLVGIFIQHTWPQYRSPLSWGSSDIQSWKVCAASFFDIIQIHIESQDPDACWTLKLVGDVITMGLVEL